MKLTIVAFACVCVGYAVSASAQTAPATSTETAAAPGDDKMICLDESAGGNSRLGTHKVCHTQKEWDALHAKHR